MSSRWKLRAAGAATCAVAVAAVLATLLASASSGGGAGTSLAPVGAEPPPTTAADVPTTDTPPRTADGPPPASEPEAPAATQPAPTPPALPAAVADGEAGAPLLVATHDGVRIVRVRAGTATMDGGFVLAGGARFDAIVNVGTGSDGESATRVLVQRAATGEVVSVGTVPGSWSPPTPVLGGPPEGMSWDGSRIVLQSTDDPGRYVAIRLDRQNARPVVVRPEGDTRFDAVSADGRLLYVRRPFPGGRGDDAVGRLYAIDLRTGRERPAPLPVEGDPGATLDGVSVARVTTGVAAYTVYEGGEAPFVLALGLAAGPASARIELPSADVSGGADGSWSIAAAPDASVAVAVNGQLGLAFVVRPDGTSREIRLQGRWNAPPPVALASDREALVRTVAGLERLDLEVARSSGASPAPAGLVALIGTPAGVLAVGGGWTPLGLVS